MHCVAKYFTQNFKKNDATEMNFFKKKLIIVELHYFENCRMLINMFSQGYCRRASEKKCTK